MGLAGRKEKQRIPHDPRNLAWADDASKFGAAYLSKLGWSAGGGLGADGDGRTTHIKVSQKLDMFGIGAAHTKDPNGIAWKQNKDFENLLRRLNGETPHKDSAGTVEGFVRADDGQKNAEDEDVETNVTQTAESSATATTSISTPTPVARRHPRRAHSARFLAAKRLATQSTASMNEILGIPCSESTSASQTSAGTPLLDAQAELKLQELTTNSQSVMDYFRAKLLAKSNVASPASVSPAETPAKVDADEDDWADRPSRGLGMGSRLKFTSEFSIKEETVWHAQVVDASEDVDKVGKSVRKEKKKKNKGKLSEDASAPEAGPDHVVDTSSRHRKDKKGKAKSEGGPVSDELEALEGSVEKKRASKKRKILEKSGDDPDPAPEGAQDNTTRKDHSRKKSKKGGNGVSETVGSDVVGDKSERKKKCRRDAAT